MTRDYFMMRYGELLFYFQCIENDLNSIYACMRKGDFDENLDALSKGNLGKTIKKLKKIDLSDGNPDLSDSDYRLLDEIRKTRNYWTHQCFLDYVYIQNEYERDDTFKKISRRLRNDHNRLRKLHKNIERFRLSKVKEYNIT